MNNRRVLRVFDALDEIPTTISIRKLMEKIEEYYVANKDNTTLLFTSRNEADADLISMGENKVRKLILKKLNNDDIEALADNLFRLFGKENQKDLFLEQIYKLEDNIKTNPLLVSQLATIYEERWEIPQTITGIYEAISKIILTSDKNIDMDIPEDYRGMVDRKLGKILKEFSAERYSRLSEGKSTDISKIFERVLRQIYEDESRERAEFLVEYLQNRAIIIEDEFYHKMLLEYYTAIKFYEDIFDEYGDIKNEEGIKELFEHYKDTFWEPVIEMFLVKEDGTIGETTTKKLYECILKSEIQE